MAEGDCAMTARLSYEDQSDQYETMEDQNLEENRASTWGIILLQSLSIWSIIPKQSQCSCSVLYGCRASEFFPDEAPMKCERYAKRNLRFERGLNFCDSVLDMDVVTPSKLLLVAPAPHDRQSCQHCRTGKVQICTCQSI